MFWYLNADLEEETTEIYSLVIFKWAYFVSNCNKLIIAIVKFIRGQNSLDIVLLTTDVGGVDLIIEKYVQYRA